MPERITSYEYNVQESETGIVVTTVKLQETADLYSSIEDAIQRKNGEVWTNRAVGATLGGIGLFGSVGFGLNAINPPEDARPDHAVVSAFFTGVSIGITIAGIKLIESGQRARKQWDKLKEFATNPQPSLRRYKRI